MKIVINTAHQRFGGAIQVALSFIYECRKFPENEYHVWVGQGVGRSLDKSDFPENFFFYEFDFGIIGFRTIKRIQQTLVPLEKKIKPDVIIATSGPTYFHSSSPQIIGYNLGLYIYPESHYYKQLSFLRKLKFFLKRKIHFYYFKRDASAYVVQTDDVNRRVRKALNTDKVFTVTNTHNGFYVTKPDFPAKLPPPEKGELRLLTISAYYQHKNLEIIPKIVEALERRGMHHIKFVLTLKDEDFRQYMVPHKNIINIGPVLPEECPSLYRECDMMFLPTLAECFSASYPEAMVMEKPILTSDLDFAHAICGDAAKYFDPLDAADIAEKIAQLVNDKTLQQTLVEAGKAQLKKFNSATERAEKYLELCNTFGRVQNIKVQY